MMQSSISLPPLSPFELNAAFQSPITIHSSPTLHKPIILQIWALHPRILHKNWFLMNTFAGNYIINMYSKCEILTEALIAFKDMRFKGCDVVSWNCLINSYSQLGHEGSATVFSLFRHMCTDGDGCGGFLTPNAFTFVGVFTAASCFVDLDDCGLEAHSIAIKMGCSRDVFDGSSLISMYCEVKVLSDARKVFDGMPQKNSVFWAAMISGYAGNRNG